MTQPTQRTQPVPSTQPTQPSQPTEPSQPSQLTGTVTFEVLSWDETWTGELAEGWVLARATVRKRMTGAIDGTSVAEVTTTGQGTGRAYSALERVEGTLDGRTGTFLLQHGGAGDETGQEAFGHIVPGTGTGGLMGLRGSAVFAHDDQGARIMLSWTL